MRISRAILACILAAPLGNFAVAQIYETKDADGNTVFTDTPTTPAEEVELQPTNIADAPPDIPEAPAADAAPTTGSSPEASALEGGDVVIIGGGDNDRLEREIVEHQRREVLEAKEKHGVGEGENMSATHREVPDRPGVAKPHPGRR